MFYHLKNRETKCRKNAICLFFLVFLFLSKAHATILAPPPITYYYPGCIPRDPQQRHTDYPLLTSETFLQFCDFIIDETRRTINTEEIKDGDLIYVSRALLDFFFTSVHPHITSRYILITHAFGEDSTPGPYARYLDDPTLAAWFCRNLDLPGHPKLFGIPIGFWESYWTEFSFEIIKKVKKLPKQKTMIAYTNHYPGCNPMRMEVDRLFANSSFVVKGSRKPYEEYIKDLAHARFVLSPEGSGIDCYRTWETLMMGSYPVVKHSTIDEVFKDLPVVLVDDWSQVTKSFLQKKYMEMKNKKYKMEKLYADYWLNKIKDCQKAVRQNRPYKPKD